MPRLASLALVALAIGGCASSPSGFGLDRTPHSLRETQRLYTRLMRWSEFERAAELVDPSARASFARQVEALGDVRFTDYRVHRSWRAAGGDGFTVRVTYLGYRASAAIEQRFEEVQRWHQVDGKSWRVTPTLREVARAENGDPR